jgi:hypothetical protein
MNARPDPFEQLAARVEVLEERVRALEGSVPEGVPVREASAAQVPVASWPEPLPQFTSVFPVIGSALLGIAGGYVLRAISGATLLPRLAVAVIAAVYAGVWLLAAGRAIAKQKIAGVLYAAVSILLLSSMLWETTIRFGAMRGTIAAAILALYVAAAAAVGLRRSGTAVFPVAFAGSAAAAVALSIASHAMAEFTFLLLAMLVFSVAGEKKLGARGARMLVALAADAGVWTLLLIYRLEPANRTDYPAVSTAVVLAAALLLFAVEVAAAARQVLARGEPLTVLQAMQAMIAFGLAAAALVWLAPGSAGGALGVLCLVLAAGCYAVGYGPARRAGQRRNFRVLNLWAACLVVAAVFISASAAAGSVLLAIAAVTAILLADRMASRTLELEGVLFLLIATGGSGLMAWTARALAGSAPVASGGAALAVAGCAVLAYAVADERRGEEWQKQALHMIPAVIAASITAGFLVLGLLGLARLVLTPDVFHVALIRTLAVCTLALGLAYAGPRLGRPAMIRTAYVAIAFVSAKLVFEDMRYGHMEFIAASIFAVAVTLIAAPRLAAKSRNVPAH